MHLLLVGKADSHLLPVGKADSHLLPVGKADSHLLPVGKADSHLLPPVLATKLGTINWSSQFLRFSGILRKTPVGIADAGTEIRFRSSESVPVFGTSGEWAACLSPFHRFASAFREGSGERLFSEKPQTVKKPPESSRGPQPFRTFNRAQRRVRWARGDFCAGKSHFPEKKSFPCSLRARKIFDF